MSATTKPLGLGRKTDVDMTEGGIVGHIITFAIPLFLGNLFQMFYNLMDTWVVGNFVNDAAFAAVSTVGNVTNLMIGFFTGFASGSGVVISQAFGAGDMDKVKRSVHTAVALTIVLSVVFTGLGISLVPLFVSMLNIEGAIAAEATTYLTIWFAGISGLMIYNMSSAILRAVGDSTRPFIFLVVSAVGNVALNLLFVLAFGMGVDGVAYATIISQGISAICCIVVLLTTTSSVKVTPRDIKFDLSLLGKIAAISFPTAIQTGITAFSNIFVHSYINEFGDAVTGGYAAYSKIDHLLVLPMQSLGIAISTFVGQNVGKREYKRAASAAHITLLLSVVITLVLMVPLMIFSDFFVGLLTPNADYISYASRFIAYMTPFYLVWTVNHAYAGALRGSGKTLVTSIISISSYVVFRQIYLFVVTNFFEHDILTVITAFPLGWILAAVSTIVYFFAVGIKPKNVA